MKILFLTLKTFSVTGGIEKFNRSFAKALWQNAEEQGWQVEVLSAYDGLTDEDYLPNHLFKGFGGNKKAFVLQAFKSIKKADIIIAGHINLASIFIPARVFFSGKKWLLAAHGREVWGRLPWIQRQAVTRFNPVLSVSRYTSAILVSAQKVAAPKIILFPNTLDPYFGKRPAQLSVQELRKKYGLAEGQPVIITVSRLAKTEKNKGYDEVLQTLPSLRQKFPDIKYLLCGKADAEEKNRILLMISELNLQNVVILTGFVEDTELPAHYQLSSLFVMPSRKEGFGIVFIEAAWWGLPVVAGNQDGSTDALLDGRLGILVDPTDLAALESAIANTLSVKPSFSDKEQKRALVEENFGFDKFRMRLKNVLLEVTI